MDKGFSITCLNCGSENTTLSAYSDEDSETVEIRCGDCGNKTQENCQ